jgi:hypothetical protein
LIRQVLGRAALSQFKDFQKAKKNEVAQRLSHVLSLIGPKRFNMEPVVSRILNEAVDLANDMAQEQALFKCQMPKTGGLPEEDLNIKVPDENQTGRIFMCTFPRFGRMIIDDGKESVVWLVPAYVELQSAFKPEQPSKE